ncbi:MAG: putative Ig domain-containing protein [Planctomycetes bacterium]|nr:putative Ig domain-containing protein [Planctomycetota bacterium]
MKTRSIFALMFISAAVLISFSCSSVVNSSPIILTNFLYGVVEGSDYESAIELDQDWGIEPYIITVTGLPEGFYFTMEGRLIKICGHAYVGMSVQSPFYIRVLVEGQFERWDFRDYILYAVNDSDAPTIDLQVTPEVQDLNYEVLFTADNISPSGLPGADIFGVFVDLSPIKGEKRVEMYDDGTNGDVDADDGIYSLNYMIGENVPTFEYVITAYVEDTYHVQGFGSTSLSIIGGPKIYHTETSSWIESFAGLHNLIAEDGTEPYSWSFEGKKPKWLSINKSTGLLSGTPPLDSAGRYVFSVRCTDTMKLWDEVEMTIFVISAPESQISICPPSGYFGDCEFGVESIDQVLTISNTGLVGLITIDDLSVAGDQATDFKVYWAADEKALPLEINPECTKMLQIYFYPQSIDPTDRNAIVTITYTDSNGAHQVEVPLNGGVRKTLTASYHEDFEASDGTFSGNVDWAYGAPTFGPTAGANSSISCWGTNLAGTNDTGAHGFGTDTALGDYYIESPEIDVTNVSSGVLCYYQWFGFAGTADNAYQNSPGIWNEGGNVWFAGSVTPGYSMQEYIMPMYNINPRFKQSDTPAPMSCFTGDGADVGGYWQLVSVPFFTADDEIKFFWQIANDGTNGGQFAGWYIDDVYVFDANVNRLQQPKYTSPSFCEYIYSPDRDVDVEFNFRNTFAGYTYSLYVGQEPDMSDAMTPVRAGTTLANTTLDVSVCLANNSGYYWRVDIDDGVETCKGKITKFTLGDKPAHAGTIQPPNNTHFYSAETTFAVPLTWMVNDGADYYNVYVSPQLPMTTPSDNVLPINASGGDVNYTVTFDTTLHKTWYVQVEAVNEFGKTRSCTVKYVFDNIAPQNVAINEITTGAGMNGIEIANFNDFPVFLGGWEIEIFSGSPGVSAGFWVIPDDDSGLYVDEWVVGGTAFVDSGVFVVADDSSSSFSIDNRADFDFGWNDNTNQLEVVLRYDDTAAVDYICANQGGPGANDPFANWVGDLTGTNTEFSFYRNTKTDTNENIDFTSSDIHSMGVHNDGQ